MTNLRTTRILFLSLVLTATLITPIQSSTSLIPIAHAEDTYTVLAPLPCIPGQGVTCDRYGDNNLAPKVTFQHYVQYSFNLFIALAAVAAVLMLVIGGFQYMTTDAVSGKSEGRERAWNAVKGLLLVLCSYLILQTINPQFVSIPVNLVPPINDRFKSIGNTTRSFFDSLSQDAANYRVQTAQLTQDREAARANSDRLRNDIESLNASLAHAQTNGDAAQAASLQLQIASKTDELRKSDSDFALLEAKTAISGGMNSTGVVDDAHNTQLNTLETLKSAETKITYAYNQGIQALQNDPAKTQDLKNAYYAAMGSLILQEYSPSLNSSVKQSPDASISELNGKIQVALNNMTDEDAKKKLSANTNSVVGDIAGRAVAPSVIWQCVNAICNLGLPNK